MDLVDDDFEIISKQKINGCAFLKMSRKEFQSLGLGFRPVKNLADFAKDCKEKKKHAFSSYRSLKEVLEKYSIKSSSITSIPQLTPGKLCICQLFSSQIPTHVFYRSSPNR